MKNREMGIMENKVTRLTVGDRILLLLINYTRFRGEMQAPIDVTQDGIATDLGIIRSAVPRAVGSLMNRGLVEENLAHIEGLARRRKVYMLTDEGMMKSRELSDTLSKEKVDVISRDGKKKSTIGVLMNEGKVDLSNISEVVSSGKIDLTAKTETAKEEMSGKSSYLHSLNPPDIFLGREREISEIKEAIASSRRKFTVVYGIPGVGKTTLAWKITRMFANEMNIFYIDLKEWTTISYFLKELASFLSGSGWNGLNDYMEANREPDIETVADLVRNIPEKIPLLIVIDDLQRAPDEISMFLSSLKERVPSMPNINVIVLSRERTKFYDIRDVRISGLIGEIELLGFDRETSKKLLLKRGFGKDEVDRVIDLTGGHPLALVLVDKEAYDLGIVDFDQFLKEEIFNRVKKKESNILGLLSLSRLQLSDDDLRTYLDIESEDLFGLVDRHLVFMTPGGYVIHDLIRDHAISTLNPDKKLECHEILASLFRKKLESLGFHQDTGGIIPPFPFGVDEEKDLGPVPLYVNEEIFHLIEAGRLNDALPVIIEALFQIPSKDLLREHGDKIIDGVKINGKMTQLQKDLLESSWKLMEGDLEGSLQLLESISKVKIKGDEDLEELVECGRLWKPFLVERVKGPEEAIKEIENISKKSIPERLEPYYLVTRASLRYKIGDYGGASTEYRTFLDSIIENEDLPEKLRESVKDAVDRAEKGSIQVATDNFQKIMELTGSNRDILAEELPYVDVDHHLLSAIYSLYHGKS